jgi:hypothetical protein
LFYASMMGQTGVAPAAPAQGPPATAAPTAGAAAPASPAAGVQAPTVTQPQSAFDANGAGALLDRIEAVVNVALGNKPAAGQQGAVGTSGTLPGVDTKSSAGKVSLDRAALDEILAEVQQLKVMLRVHR